MVIDGGDCVSDLGALAEQPDLFGSVASHSTATRLLQSLSEAELAAIRAARRVARERAWALGARPATVTLDFDAQLLECHTEKEGAAGHRKGGFGFHPLHCFLDETGEQLAAILRPGNAGSNTAADHVEVLDAALAQLPADVGDREREQPVEILARSDSAGATHAFAAALRQRKVCFSLGYYVDERVGEALLALPKRRWRRALAADGSPRRGAWVAELNRRGDLSAWPEGTRLIVRKERPHAAARSTCPAPGPGSPICSPPSPACARSKRRADARAHPPPVCTSGATTASACATRAQTRPTRRRVQTAASTNEAEHTPTALQ